MVHGFLAKFYLVARSIRDCIEIKIDLIMGSL